MDDSDDDFPRLPDDVDLEHTVEINIPEEELDVMDLCDALKRRPDVAHATYFRGGNTLTVYIEPEDLLALNDLDASIVPSGVLAKLVEHAYVPLNIQHAENGDYSEDCIKVTFCRGEDINLTLHDIARRDDHWFDLDTA